MCNLAVLNFLHTLTTIRMLSEEDDLSADISSSANAHTVAPRVPFADLGALLDPVAQTPVGVPEGQPGADPGPGNQ